jgi:hypothetical protein
MLRAEKLLVFRKPLETCPGVERSDIPLRSISVGDLDGLELPTDHKVRIARAINSGDDCFALVQGSQVTHHSLVSSEGRFRQPVFAQLICRGGIYIYDCWTHEAHRGKGTYSAVLGHLGALNRGPKRFALMDAWASNVPSVRGIQKAGFQFVAAFTVWGAGPIRIIVTPAALSQFVVNPQRICVRLHRQERSGLSHSNPQLSRL